jgi:enediyne biosynthesis protein E4
MTKWFFCLATFAAVISGGPSLAQDVPLVPSFVDETDSAGIDSTYTGEWEYIVGGGVATFDCNADGMTDMLIAGGASPAKFYANIGVQAGPLQFELRESGLELEAVSGTYPMDIDSDAITDLVLLRVGENVVMRGLGDCKFARANEDWGFDGGDAWSAAFAATWEKGADWPTLAVGNYIDRTQEAFPWGSCTDNWLHRGGAGRFGAPLPLKPSFCALSMLFTDWNRSGTPSLRVSNDREYYKGGQEQLWHVLPGQAPALYTADEGWKPLKIWGMGIASRDVTGDGYPDYYLTSMADNKLQTIASPPANGALPATFADVAFAKKLIAQRPYIGTDLNPSTAWHAQFEDVNNDGLTDLFVAKGNVWAMPDFALLDPDNLLLQTADGTFIEVGDKAGVGSLRTGRGAALADFNMDGLMDLVVVNRGEKAQLWRNTTAGAGAWVGYRLDQPGVNRQGIGAFVEVRVGDVVQSREITVGGGHASGQSGWWHAGLGAATEAEVRVIWPDGREGAWEKLAAGAFYLLSPDQAAVVWQAP